MKKKIILFFLFFAILVSCSTTVSNLRENPSMYNMKSVSLSGDVTETFSIPATGIMIYLLYDKTGTIPVLSIKKRKTGDYVSIKARVFAISTKGVSSNVDTVIETIIDYLKDKNIIKGRLVDLTAKGIAKVIKVILAKTEGSYLLVEDL